MFARFRNLFSKNKAESETEAEVESSSVVVETSPIYASAPNEVNDSNEAVSPLEGLNLLKSLVETEKRGSNVGLTRDLEKSEHEVPSLSQEVAEMLKNKLSNYNANTAQNEEVNGIKEEVMITAETSCNGNHVNGFSAEENVELNGTHDLSSLPIESENFLINSTVTSESTIIHNKNPQLSEIENTAEDLNSLSKSVEISNNESNLNESLPGNANELKEISKICSEILNNDGISLDQWITENSTEIESLEKGGNDEETTNIERSFENSSVQLTDVLESNEILNISESDNAISLTETETKEISEPKSNLESESIDISKDYKETPTMANENDSKLESSTQNSSSPIESPSSSTTPLNELTTEKIQTSESNDTSNDYKETPTMALENDSELESSTENSSCPIESQPSFETTSNELTTEKIPEYNDISNGYKETPTMANEYDSKLESSTQNSSCPIESQTLSSTHLNELTTEKIPKSNDISHDYKDSTNMSNETESELESSNSENSSCPIESQSSSVTPLEELPTEKILESNDIPNDYQETQKLTNEIDSEPESSTDNSACPIESKTPSASQLNDLEIDNELTIENDIVNDILQDIIAKVTKINFTNDPENIQSQYESSLKNSHENSPEFSESSQTSSMISVKENNASSSSVYPTTDSETNHSNNSSIVVEDLPSELNTPSPTVDSHISVSSCSNTSTLDSSIQNESTTDPTKIIVNPINSNSLACNAITSKLADIAEVAESLDTVIRQIQQNSQTVAEVEVESNPSPSDKKLNTLRSTSSEDWHSRSTEDDSFATASEGNFTPHSHSSSSFQTASGRTSSYISCDKSSFDASEADDSTFAFEMPELTSPLNMSFEESEQSYISAQQLNSNGREEDHEQTPTKLSESGGSQTLNPLEEDQNSIADIEDIHSESVTPTPHDLHDYHVESIQIESETELDGAGISDAPSMAILTEQTAMPMSRTPEVSSTNVTDSAAACSNQPVVNSDGSPSNEQNTNKPNAAWRRSKYYENITKQTIKGFL